MTTSTDASERIDEYIAGLPDWRGETLAKVRAIIRSADPDVVEEWKWMGSPVWACDGMIAVGNAHKGKVKLTFSHGASLPDPGALFNNGFNGNVWRAIDIGAGEGIDTEALAHLVREAIAYNQGKAKLKRPRAKSAKTSE
jgi:hypothetical protein